MDRQPDEQKPHPIARPIARPIPVPRVHPVLHRPIALRPPRQPNRYARLMQPQPDNHLYTIIAQQFALLLAQPLFQPGDQFLERFLRLLLEFDTVQRAIVLGEQRAVGEGMEKILQLATAIKTMRVALQMYLTAQTEGQGVVQAEEEPNEEPNEEPDEQQGDLQQQ